MRVAKLQSLKKLWLALNVALKTVLASSLILIVAAIGLFAPWYPMTTSQLVPQTQSDTTQFEVPMTTTVQMQIVYTHPDSVTIPSAPSVMIGLLSPWQSRTFNLQSGLSLFVSVTLSPSSGYAVFIWENFPPFDRINFTMNGVLQGYSNVIAKSGSYDVTISNLNTDGPLTFSSLSVSEGISETVQLTQTRTTYSTTSVTQYSQILVSPYTTLGMTTSATVLALIVLIVALSIIFERQKR